MNDSPPPPPAPPPAEERKKLWLAAEGPLAAGVLAAFARILDYAREQAGACAEAPERSVHEFRKSIRRARALAKLLRAFLPEGDYRAVADGLRRAMRRTSTLRDVDVLLAHAQRLVPGDGEQAALQALTGHLQRRRDQHDGGETGDALREGCARIRPLPGRLGASLPLALRERDLRWALRRGYRRVRRSFLRAQAAPRDEEAVHDMRKRVKELRYQLELLRERSAASEPLQRLGDLAEALGQVTDLFVLRAYLRTHRPALGPCHPGPLLERLGAEASARTDEALALAAQLFAPKPGAFVRGVLDVPRTPGLERP